MPCAAPLAGTTSLFITAHVRLDIGGAIITASITNEAVEELALAVGDEASAVVKATDVMIAKE